MLYGFNGLYRPNTRESGNVFITQIQGGHHSNRNSTLRMLSCLCSSKYKRFGSFMVHFKVDQLNLNALNLIMVTTNCSPAPSSRAHFHPK